MSIKYILQHLRFVRVGQRIALTLILALLVTASWGQENLDGEVSGTLDIWSKGDRDSFVENVNNGNTYKGWIVNLRASMPSINKRVGYAYHREKVTVPVIGGEMEAFVPRPFSGTFNGNGYNMDVDIRDDDEIQSIGTALFGYIKGATIKNINLTGRVVGGKHAAGLVGVSDSTGNRIENCVVSVAVSGGTHVGGVLGHGKSSDISIDSVVFRGILLGGSEAKGAFLGWGDDGGIKSVTNSLYNNLTQDTSNFDFVKMNAGNVNVENLYKTADYGTYGTLVSLSAPKVPMGYENIVVKKRIAKSVWLDFSMQSPTFYIANYTVVSSATTEMTNGFYWVTDDVTIDSRIVVNGDVTLYLDEGKTLNATKGIEVSEGNKLTIDGLGTLNAKGEKKNAGIGGGNEILGGTIIIKGGTVSAESSEDFGIGGGLGGGTIAINGGKVSAIGKGIGGAGAVVTLGWTNDDDFIYSSGFQGESLDFVEGKRFYFFKNGIYAAVTADNVSGSAKTLFPLKNEKDLNIAHISGIQPYYFYTGDVIELTYKIIGVDGNELVKNMDYMAALDKSTIKDVGKYTFMIKALEGSGCTGSKLVSFEVVDYEQVTVGTSVMHSGYYRVSDDVTIDSRISIDGDVTLFLDSGKTLNATRGINLSNGNKLTIKGEGTLNAKGDSLFSGIGAYDVGTLVIESGIINATGGAEAAGIGGDIHNVGGGNIEIKGGTVTAMGGASGSGIGGGSNRDWAGSYGVCGVVSITGGKVTAYGSGEYPGTGIGPGYPFRQSGVVTLGWTNEDDFVHASYAGVASFNFVEGKQFYYVDNGKNVVAAIEKVKAHGWVLYPFLGEHSLKHAAISGVETSYSYTGNEISPNLVTGFNGESLTSGVDYNVSITKNGVEASAVGVGEYVLTLTGKGYYNGTKEVKFSIVPDVVGDYAAVQVLKDENGTHAVVNADYSGRDTLKIPDAIKVDEIDYERELSPFTPATAVLPFRLPEGTTLNAKFYYVKEVEQVGCSWNAVMKYIGAANLPQPNTPYAVILNKDEDKLEFDLHGKKATVQTAEIADQYDASGKWIFKGVYSYKVWERGDDEIGLAYAFSGSSDGTVPKGHFGRIAIGSKASPMRSYLRKVSSDVRLNCSTQAAPAAARAWGAAAYTANFSNASAEVINVKFVEDDESGKEKTTAIGRLNTATGEIKIDRWYDLKGRKVNNVNRAAKGAYYRRRIIDERR